MDDAGRWVEGASRGDEHAVDALLVRYLPELETYIRRRAVGVVAAKESGADVVQSVCREVLKQLAGGRFVYRDESAFKHWLFEAALLKLKERVRFWRAEKRDLAREERPAIDPAGASAADVKDRFLLSLATPSRAADANERLERARQAFAALNAEQREIILLARIEGLPHAEIALRLGKDEAHCRVLLSRALARLGTLLARP